MFTLKKFTIGVLCEAAESFQGEINVTSKGDEAKTV